MPEKAFSVCIKDSVFIDPCMGSGHILVYAFDVLIQIYKEYGYSERDAAQSILQNNLYGLDIDDRAAQLAYFAVMMKARQYDRRIFTRGIQPNVYAIVESNGLDSNTIDYFTNNDPKLKKDFGTLVDELRDAKEYGSILNISQVDFAALYARVEEVRGDISLFREMVLNDVEPLIRVAEIMAQKYDVVVTNPPYMGSGNMCAKLSEHIKKVYPNTKNDLSTVFMEKTLKMCNSHGYMSMINIPVWMFLPSYEKLRINILENNTYINMIHPGRGIFGSDFGTTTFVIGKRHITGYRGNYHRLFDKQGEVESIETREQQFLSGKGVYIPQQEIFSQIPCSPVAYWVSQKAVDAYKYCQLMSDVGQSTKGIITGDNDRYMRLWWEVQTSRINFDATSDDDAARSAMKWFPCTKGGNFRKWYGNKEYIMNWENRGYRILNDAKIEKRHSQDYYNHLKFKQGISWSVLTASTRSFRIENQNLIEHVGMAIFPHNSDLNMYVLGFMNSAVCAYYLTFLSPTVAVNAGEIGRLPLCIEMEHKPVVENLVSSCIFISTRDWDSFECSWDFTRHPLVPLTSERHEQETSQFHSSRMERFGRIAWHFENWENDCMDRFARLKSSEEEINSLFIKVYSLQDELTSAVKDDDVTVRTADLGRDIRSLISYAVGCMFGRYSLDVPGLAYAGGAWDASKYSTIIPDKDNIIPICDDDYFDDDITGRFVEFVRMVYGDDTLEENLKFIADALGGKGTPREVIRNYFINDFYADHLKIYQKRPIYWLFDSGKKNGFKALIYMHRYQSDLLARLRTDYVHEQQERYRTQLSHLADAIDHASASERVKLTKQQKKIQEQALEIQKYEEKVHHLADRNIQIDLDDGVKHNYELFADVLAKIK